MNDTADGLLLCALLVLFIGAASVISYAVATDTVREQAIAADVGRYEAAGSRTKFVWGCE